MPLCQLKFLKKECLKIGAATVFLDADLGFDDDFDWLFIPGTPVREMAGELDRVRFSGHSPHNQWAEYMDLFPNAKKYLMHYPGFHKLSIREDVTIPRMNRSYSVGHEEEDRPSIKETSTQIEVSNLINHPL